MPVGWYLTGFDDGQRATVEELGDVDGAGALVEGKAEGRGADRPCGGRAAAGGDLRVAARPVQDGHGGAGEVGDVHQAGAGVQRDRKRSPAGRPVGKCRWQRLVAASGTAGDRIDVWGTTDNPNIPQGLTEYLAGCRAFLATGSGCTW